MTETDPITVVDDSTCPEWSRLILRGRITIALACQLRDAAIAVAARGKHVRVCCDETEQLDVAAIQVILGLRRDLAICKKQCDVTNVPEAIGKLFRLVGLETAA